MIALNVLEKLACNYLKIDQRNGRIDTGDHIVMVCGKLALFAHTDARILNMIAVSNVRRIEV